MIKTRNVFLVVGILLLGACSVPQTPIADQAVPETAAASSVTPISKPLLPTPDIPGISVEQVCNSEYQLGLLDQIRTVQLNDSHYQEGTQGDEDYLSVSITDFIARGDLNGDGENEAVAIVTEYYGNSGTFYFLVVYQYLNDEPVFVTSIYIDDQPLFNELAIEDGEIFVDVATHDANDPTCCPSIKTRRHYWLNGANLILTDYSTKTPAGDPRVITIEAPLDGIQVSGVVRIKGDITIAPFENNLIYRIYDLGGVELSAGPINVDATGLGSPGTFEKAIDLGDILTNTTIRITVEDINVKDGSLFAMDSVILLVR
jgi:hypothetical protein